jgi:cobaltochelatase CobN
MHFLRTETRSLDETASAVDLDQTPAQMVVLSFSDSDLGALAVAFDAHSEALPSLRLASLTQLKHPYSVDIYLEKVASKARFVLVRLLGGLDYWRYGVDELAALARARGFHLALIPGDQMEDPRLDAAATLPQADLRRLCGYFQEGGPENMRACLQFMAGHLCESSNMAAEPKKILHFDRYGAGCRVAKSGAPRALIVLYRSIYLAADVAPILALADGLAGQGFAVTSVFATSLKDPAVFGPLTDLLATEKPDVILNTTAFSARHDDCSGVLDSADVPVFQVPLAGSRSDVWASSARGLSAADLAMNIVLPEIDGRIITSAISFKAEAEKHADLEFTRLVHRAEPSRIAHVVKLAFSWARLRRSAVRQRRLACILSDYPAKHGRTGYAVGLDTPKSVVGILAALRCDGYKIDAPSDGQRLMDSLTKGAGAPVMGCVQYKQLLAGLPIDFVMGVEEVWGVPEDDPAVRRGAFHFRFLRSGNIIVAVQPDRGRPISRKSDFHSPVLAPCHSYVAFYLWLRHVEQIHALIHCGTHGTLEWLPGKSVALSESCAPEAVLGAVPVIYPFIVNNPGEAAQAKRRTAALTIGHLTPPLMAAGSHGAVAELEGLFDEYAQAQSLDPRRATILAELILERAAATGLIEEIGVTPANDAVDQLQALDAWLCDLKEMRIGDGLHVFGEAPEPQSRTEMIATLRQSSGARDDTIGASLDACAGMEMRGLRRALDGRFVPPGPAGAPSRGRLDVLPTGRNLYTIDPRTVPTRTAWEIGRRTADEVVMRYAQDHGEWPKRIVLDLWGSASMRTGGDDLAQALALIGVRPCWDNGSHRVMGFDILSIATLGRSRVDVTVRISGLFRDVFPAQIGLFDAAIRAVAALEEDASDNPLAGDCRATTGSVGGPVQRIFGAAPGQYGIGLSRKIAHGEWQTQNELGQAYLASTTHAYGAADTSVPAEIAFRDRVASSDAFVHVQDMNGQDVLDSDAFAEHEGGFASAAALLGNAPVLFHVDNARPDKTAVRSLSQEIARVVRGRATNPRWIDGQMRHGYRGAAEIAETVDNLFAFAAMTNAVPSRHFDLMFDATCGNEQVRQFLVKANPEAARSIAHRFEEAVRRGFWISRRNSCADILANLCGAT